MPGVSSDEEVDAHSFHGPTEGDKFPLPCLDRASLFIAEPLKPLSIRPDRFFSGGRHERTEHGCCYGLCHVLTRCTVAAIAIMGAGAALGAAIAPLLT